MLHRRRSPRRDSGINLATCVTRYLSYNSPSAFHDTLSSLRARRRANGTKFGLQIRKCVDGKNDFVRRCVCNECGPSTIGTRLDFQSATRPKDNSESQPMHVTSRTTPAFFWLVAGKSFLSYWIIICDASAESRSHYCKLLMFIYNAFENWCIHVHLAGTLHKTTGACD